MTNMADPISAFYLAFQRLDPESMVALYHPDIIFSDPAFGTLQGQDAKDMWRMLCSRSRDLEITFSDVRATEDEGSARWKAQYTFSGTRRLVKNDIQARFKLLDGRIVSHHDAFDLRKWAQQAMGWKGYLLGGTTFFKKRLQQRTKRMLSDFQHSDI